MPNLKTGHTIKTYYHKRNEMKVIRKDFVNEYTESFCGSGKRLASGKAYVMIDSYGNEVYAGKKCAILHSDTDLTQIPDLTKSLISSLKGTNRRGKRGETNNGQQDTRKSRALTYLLLREEKLLEFKNLGNSLSYDVLQSYYQTYQVNHDLSDNTIEHILNIENKTSKKLL